MATQSSAKTRRSRAPLAVALMVLMASGIGHQWLASRYARAGESVPLPPGSLQQFPLEFEGWSGREVPLDERIIQATDTDDHLHRVYTQGPRRQAVGLWVAYGVRFRDLMPHRPEVCYVGAGWTLESSELIEIQAADGRVLPCGLQRFTRGALGGERVTVLNYYLLDEEYSADVSAVRRRIWRFDTGLKYVAQVQISAADGPMRTPGRAAVSGFAAVSAPILRELLADSVAAAEAGAATANEAP